MRLEEIAMEKFMESEAFCSGVAVGINLYQQKVVSASKHREPLQIDGELYYVQNGRERLQEMIEKVCK